MDFNVSAVLQVKQFVYIPTSSLVLFENTNIFYYL
jgi:hypothetical protein